MANVSEQGDPQMEKPASTDHPIHRLLQNRWSPRAFSEKTVDADLIRSLLEAARWAPSSFNEQPWYFIVATIDEPTEHNRLLACLAEANRQWARKIPVLMLSVAKLSFERNGNPNRHALHDVGMALENLAIQATAMHLHVHPMAGFDVEKARETYRIPAGYDPVTAIAIGYTGDSLSLPDDLRVKELAPRERRPLDTFVFSGAWGKTSEIVR
jgi:nitroreductase